MNVDPMLKMVLTNFVAGMNDETALGLAGFCRGLADAIEGPHGD